jgi:septal ring factor EnvC (AmiA/AmiB activator)
MAGEFHETFGLGDDDGSIGSVDADGVAFAAIQGLSRELDARDERIDALEAAVDERDDRIATLEAETDELRAENEALRAETDELHDRLDAIEARLGDAGSPSPGVPDD